MLFRSGLVAAAVLLAILVAVGAAARAARETLFAAALAVAVVLGAVASMPAFAQARGLPLLRSFSSVTRPSQPVAMPANRGLVD